MSELREQLQQARDAYHAMYYDGDLASEIDVNGRGYNGRLWIGIAAGAIAAAVLLMVWLQYPAVNSSGSKVAVLSESRPPTVATSTETATEENVSLGDISQNITLVPPAQSLDLPGIPAFPSWETSESETSSTTKESV